MDILNQIVNLMNKEEVRHFKLFTSRTQSNGPRKDLQLFDYIRKSGESYDEHKIFQKLYEENGKNPFYRLKNRLLGDLNKCLILQHVEEDDNIFIYHLMSLAKFYRNKTNYKLSLHYIKKAEKKAIQLENYELLDFIYTELIRLSHDIVSINPEEYIKRRKENREKLHFLREIDDILAAVRYRLAISQNFASKEHLLFELLQKTVDDFAENETVRESPKLRFTLYQAVQHILLSRHDYPTLEAFLLKTYKEFSEEGLFSKANLDKQLEMLTYILNTLYLNGKLKESLIYCEQLGDAMESNNRQFYAKYQVFYYNGLVLNYNKLDRAKSISILEDIISNETFTKKPFYEFLFYANLSVSYYFKGSYSKALKTLVKLSIHDGNKLAGEGLKLQISIFELILRLEINDFDTVNRRIENVRKEFKELLETSDHHNDHEFIALISEINSSTDFITDQKLMKRVKTFLDQKPVDKLEDYSILDPYNWLSNKMSIIED